MATLAGMWRAYCGRFPPARNLKSMEMEIDSEAEAAAAGFALHFHLGLKHKQFCTDAEQITADARAFETAFSLEAGGGHLDFKIQRGVFAEAILQAAIQKKSTGAALAQIAAKNAHRAGLFDVKKRKAKAEIADQFAIAIRKITHAGGIPILLPALRLRSVVDDDTALLFKMPILNGEVIRHADFQQTRPAERCPAAFVVNPGEAVITDAENSGIAADDEAIFAIACVPLRRRRRRPQQQTEQTYLCTHISSRSRF